MTQEQWEQFGEGFFKMFKWRLKLIEEMTQTEILRYEMKDIDQKTLLETLEYHVFEVGSLRTLLQSTFRLAKMETEDFPEFNDALSVWYKTDRYVFSTYTAIKHNRKPPQRANKRG